MLYGADYNPDQWPEDVWDDDVRLMREAGVNVVSLGIFAWSRIQPAEDVWDFAWLDTVIGKLHAGGIGVNLATATASPPPWVSANYPETLPADESGVRPSHTPVVIATGTNDDTTPVGMARHFVRRSREGGSKLAYFEIPGAGHRLLLHANVVDRLIRSFVTHSLGDADDVVSASISGDARRPPDSLPMQPAGRIHLSGPMRNAWSVVAWKARGGRQLLI